MAPVNCLVRVPKAWCVREHDRHIAERTGHCPLIDAVEIRIRPVEEALVAEKAAKQTARTWMDRIWPLIWAAIGIFGLLVLQNATDLLKHLK